MGLQPFGYRDQVKRLAFVVQGLNGVVDNAVVLTIKIVGLHPLNYLDVGLLVQEQPAQHRLFRLNGMRRGLQRPDFRIRDAMCGLGHDSGRILLLLCDDFQFDAGVHICVQLQFNLILAQGSERAVR